MTPSLPRFALAAAATVVVACALGAWPTVAWGGSSALLGVAAAAGISLVTALVGYLPVALSEGAPLERRAQAFLAGMGLRMFLTLGALLALWTAKVPQRSVVLLWTGILYGILLALEIAVVVRGLGRPERNGGPAIS